MSELHPQRIDEILASRADRLAQRHTTRQEPVRTRDILLLKVGGHLVGLDVAYAREIVRVEHFAAVPDASEQLLGVLNIHNEFHALLDPCAALDIERPTERYTWAILLKHETLHVALACDEVIRLESLPVEVFDEQDTFRYHETIGVLLDATSLLSSLEQPLPTANS